eukprot:SAG31_NODE_41521_length_275_cov_1.460227_1_plen_37_part_01
MPEPAGGGSRGDAARPVPPTAAALQAEVELLRGEGRP